ncbi:MAG: hypothetical protein KC476_01510 [Cyanobacteria bacterium HKST-UBA06]|nr:hypothetical protein [Cyanobacteria bacterium HKST-UBA05]MCA9798949.1 hypothetical protein [Cyanobacteria bacterium HKST-UBA04]MCA9806608.1 hypothetical protein [Cyanobacteria bacterium HKST-UBA06]MCA9840795.1 hypothetical protein [Cyanobacteria bacterium HKST-UBA03]
MAHAADSSNAHAEEQRPWIKQLTTHVIAAELNLTFFAARKGKDSPEYQNALKEFATVWYLLKQNRHRDEFVKEIVA